MNAGEILDKLQRVRKTPNGWTALCPAHDDKDPSLSISEGEDGRILLNCFASCTPESICAAIGIRVADLFSGNGNHQRDNPKTSAPKTSSEGSRFEGTEETVDQFQLGLVRSEECRRYIESRGVSLTIAAELKWGFASEWPFSGEHGTIRKPALTIPHYVDGKLVGIKARTICRQKLWAQMRGSRTDGLYGLDHHDASASDIFVFEGPMDCAVALSAGYNAAAIHSTTSKLAAGDVAMLSTHERIFLVGDMDGPGQLAMDALQRKLPEPQTYRIRWPYRGAAEPKDLGDLFLKHGEKFLDRFREAIARAEADRLRKVRVLSDILPIGDLPDIAEDYCVQNFVLEAGNTMICAPPEKYKSWIAYLMARGIITGNNFLGRFGCRHRQVVYLDRENSPHRIKHRGQIIRIDAGNPLLKYWSKLQAPPKLGDPRLIEIAAEFRPVFIFDTLIRFGSLSDENASAEIAKLLEKCDELVQYGATNVILHHPPKSGSSWFRGSGDLEAFIDMGFSIEETAEGSGQFRLICEKNRDGEHFEIVFEPRPWLDDTGDVRLVEPPYLKADDDVKTVVSFVASKGKARREDIKRNAGIQAKRAVIAVNIALRKDLLIEDSKRFLSVPNSGNGEIDWERSQKPGTSGNGNEESGTNA